MSFDISDLKETTLISNCCSSWMYDFGGNYTCGACKEPCDAVTTE